MKGCTAALHLVIAGLATLAAVAERQGAFLSRETREASVAFLPLVFAAVAFGPFAARRSWPPWLVSVICDAPILRWAVYLPVRALTAAAAGWRLGQLSSEMGELPS